MISLVNTDDLNHVLRPTVFRDPRALAVSSLAQAGAPPEVNRDTRRASEHFSDRAPAEVS